MKMNVIKKTELKRKKLIEVWWNGFKWNGMGSSGIEWM